MINESTGTGRRNADVTRVRAVFIDFDGAPLPDTWPLEPHILVESSPGKWHVYYLVSNLPLSAFKVVQQALAKHYNADTAVSALSQVMRIPGFFHSKDKPVMSRLHKVARHDPFSWAELLEALPFVVAAVADNAAAQHAAQPTASRAIAARDSSQRRNRSRTPQGIPMSGFHDSPPASEKQTRACSHSGNDPHDLQHQLATLKKNIERQAAREAALQNDHTQNREKPTGPAITENVEDILTMPAGETQEINQRNNNGSSPHGHNSPEYTAPTRHDQQGIGGLLQDVIQNTGDPTDAENASHATERSKTDSTPATGLRPEVQAPETQSRDELHLATPPGVIRRALIDSHAVATEQLAPYKEDLGLAYPTALVLARLSIEHATDANPSPHIFAPHWAIGILVGRNKDTVGRHMRNTPAFSLLFDRAKAFTAWLKFPDPDAPTESAKSETKAAGMMIRYFPGGRRSPQCRISDYYQRDLYGDSEQGKTEIQYNSNMKRRKGAHSRPVVAPDSPVHELLEEYNLPIRVLIPDSKESAEVPRQVPSNMDTLSPEEMLIAARTGLARSMHSLTSRKNPPSKKVLASTYSRFVEHTAAMLVSYFNDRSYHKAWMGALYTCLRNELYNEQRPKDGWSLLTRLFRVVAEHSASRSDESVQNILAIAWNIVNQDGFKELTMNYGHQPVNIALPPSPDFEPDKLNDKFDDNPLPF